VASRRKVSNPLALAVMALLYERPMHPYEMVTLMRERGKHESVRLRYSSLYSVVSALEREGLILPKETVREGKRPERTIYEITDTGREEFLTWLRELLREPVKEYTQFAAGVRNTRSSRPVSPSCLGYYPRRPWRFWRSG
jgi:DNA-binding PadR family transcriptional regulator